MASVIPSDVLIGEEYCINNSFIIGDGGFVGHGPVWWYNEDIGTYKSVGESRKILTEIIERELSK